MLPFEHELPHVGHVEEADRVAHGGVLRDDPCVLDGHEVAGEGHETRAEGAMLLDQRCLLQPFVRHGRGTVAAAPLPFKGSAGATWAVASTPATRLSWSAKARRARWRIWTWARAVHMFSHMTPALRLLAWAAIVVLPGGVFLLPVVIADGLARRRARRANATAQSAEA